MAITPEQPRSGRSSARKLLWFVGLWLAGVATVGAVSLLLHLWIGTW